MDDRELKNRIEAVLFTTGRYMDIEELAKHCDVGSLGIIKDALLSLQQEYEQRGSAMGIFEMDGKFKLNIRKDYGELANKLVSGDEFDHPTTKTLAVIAYKNPALQHEIIKVRGNKAYDHIKRLLESELITSQKQGRTRLLKLTSKFYDYFDTAEAHVKQQFDKIKEVLEQEPLEQSAVSPPETLPSDQQKA